MNCPKCGEQLPSSARFCFGCGAPVTVDRANSAPRYETCEVDAYFVRRFGLGLRRNHLIEFVGVATGPNGRYRALASPPVHVSILEDGERDYQSGETVVVTPDQKETDQVCNVFDEFVWALGEEGWNLQSQSGEMWYQLRFCRPIS